MELIDICKIVDNKNDIMKHDRVKEFCILNSIKKYGQLKPVIINDKNEIIEGHFIYRSLKRLNYDKIYIKKLANVNQKQLYCELNLTQREMNIIDFFEYIKDHVNIDDNNIPYSKNELKKFKEMLNFDWSQYGENEGNNENDNSFFKFM